jgi:uncharacterized membrane-anchored protein YjiN (DUF445 family)
MDRPSRHAGPGLQAIASDQALKVGALRRIKFTATALLAFCALLFLLARTFEPRFQALAWVAAFAEAAMIGGLADWYAVVALFRRPLGLPIPHTAIIPENQERIAESLATFVEVNFLAPGPVAQKLREVDFAAMAADWLAGPRRAGALARFIIKLLPEAMSAAQSSGLKAFVADQTREAIKGFDVGPWAAAIMATLVEGRRYRTILDGLLAALGRVLLEPRSVEAIKEKIHAELPRLLNMLGVDTLLLGKILGSASSLIEEMQADPEHPLRLEIDTLFAHSVEDFRTSHEYQSWLNNLKNSLLSRPETAELFQIAWDGLDKFIEADADKKDSQLRARLTELLMSVASKLREDEILRDEINTGMVTVLARFIDTQKKAISLFVSGQVKSWDIAHMTSIIETNVGRDLQYIRFNGTLIGGLIGVALYAVQLLIHWG